MIPVIICIYLRTTDRHFRDQENVGRTTSKLLRYDFVQILTTFRNPSLGIFAAANTRLVINTIPSSGCAEMFGNGNFNLHRNVEICNQLLNLQTFA